MNVIFTVIIAISSLTLLFLNPEGLLPALMDGAKKGGVMCITLFCIYAVWMGVEKLSERSGLCTKVSAILRPTICKLFKSNDKLTTEYIAMNISCNLLGLGGAATPYAVKGIERLEKTGNDYAQKLLFVINATSIQLIPTTVISLRSAAGSATPSDIFLPSLVCTFLSTLLGVTLFMLFNRLCRTSSRL
jgi:spore maturation protein A